MHEVRFAVQVLRARCMMRVKLRRQAMMAKLGILEVLPAVREIPVEDHLFGATKDGDRGHRAATPGL